MIIGLTGKNAAGKGEILKYLVGRGFIGYSLSDALREEATKQVLEHSRDNLIKLGNQMRGKYGNGILASKINEKINDDRKNGTENFVIDSIRNPGEIEELRKNKDFILIGVHTDAKIRFNRLIKRGREGDSKNFEEFLEHEKKENNNAGSGQQLDKCLEMSDKIISSNGTVQEANSDLDNFLNSLAKNA
jgi:dephospho-CoA kinase